MANEGREYKFQTGYTKNGSMFHVRADDFDEYKEACEQLGIPYRLDEEKPVELHPEVSGDITERLWEGEKDESMCIMHNTKMKERNGPTGKFFSHARELPTGKWDYCSGTGWASERKP